MATTDQIFLFGAMKESTRQCVVTGGSGFLGRHLVDALLAKDRPPTQVMVFDLRPYKHHNPDTEEHVDSYTGSVTKLGDLVKAFSDATVVFHCVSANPVDNQNEQLMWSVNVDGTKNVIEACKQCKVPKLVFISTASVVFDGRPLRNVDETTPYPKRYLDYYSQTKAEAERLVLAANRPALLTCALRPSSIFGERDPLYVPRLIEAGRLRKSRFIIGDGKTKWEFTYVGNVASACLKAADHMSADSPVGGQAYFITNDENTPFWEHIGTILKPLGYPPPSVHLPFMLCYIIAAIVDLVLMILSPIYKPAQPPSFTKQRVVLLSTDRSLSCEKAKRDFGYEASVSMAEANRRTIEFFKPQAARDEDKKE